MQAGHEQAWADALAQEHLHQRELLATLRDELGALARECAAALTALDAVVGLAGVSEAVSAAGKAKLAVDVARRAHGGAPKRSDRELLTSVASASGAQAELEAVIGPASWAALQAMQPLVKWIRGGDARELDVAQVLGAAAALGAGADATLASDAAALEQSLRDAAEHVEGAAKAVREGKLAQVLAESRATLEADLASLHSVVERADEAPAEWKKARRDEHAELTEEVRTKLERVERIRAAMFRILPQLQTAVRALGVAERARTLEHRLDPEPVAAARATLVGAAEDVLAESVPSAKRPRRLSRQARWAAVAAVVLVGAIVAIVLAVGGSSKAKPVVTETASTPAATTTAPATPGAKPHLLPVKAVFEESQRATFYTIGIEQGGEQVTAYVWTLTTPPGNPTCNMFAAVPGKPFEAVWHHASTDGCTHNGPQHDGTVHVHVLTADWSCTESFFGTLTRTGAPNAQCRRR